MASLEDSLARLLDQPVTYNTNVGTMPTPDSVALGPVAASDPIVTTTPAATPVPAATTGAAAPAAAPAMPDYKSYHEYYADNPEALAKAGYLGTAGQPLSTTTGEGGGWGASGNPYQYRNEYNEYLSTMPTEYQALGKSNITGAAVKSGAITGVYDPATKQTYSVGPDVAPGTVKAGSATTPTNALTKPTNPGSRAPWQQSQQYWKDLDAYTRAGGK